MNKKELIKHFENMPYVSVSQMGKKSFVDLIEQLDEPQKVTIPQFVADWIKKCKTFEHLISLSFALNPVSWEENRLSDECIDWLKSTSNQEIFARAWLDGYTVEKEPKYIVKIIGITDYNSYLNYRKAEKAWTIESKMEIDAIRTNHTYEELEQAGFGWVFDCPGMEVVEVEE